MGRIRQILAIVCVLSVVVSGADPAAAEGPPTRAAATPPDGFVDERVADIGSPTDMAFTPDGRLLVTRQDGTVHVVRNGVLASQPAVDLTSRTCSNSERGVLGIAVDPQFQATRNVFVFYTLRAANGCGMLPSPIPGHRVSRFTLGDDDRIEPSSEVVLLEGIPSPSGIHNGGDIAIGPDGLVYVSVGDGGCGLPDKCPGDLRAGTRSLTVPLGKIFRVGRDGSVPATNPAAGTGSRRCLRPGGAQAGTGPCAEAWATGLRNPFRITFSPGGELFINDTGAQDWEEINKGVAGADYGWPVREGRCLRASTTSCPPPGPGFTDPYFTYRHAAGCEAITGGTFAPSTWPAPYGGSYFFGDYVCGSIFRLAGPASSPSQETFLTGLGVSSAVALQTGPAPGGDAVYYTTYAGGGEVRRIRFVSQANRPPTAVLQAGPLTGSAPLDVAFDASGSFDPDDDPLTYRWAFGDGATRETTVPSLTHRYGADGIYDATVTVRDGAGGEATDSISIQVGNKRPTVSVTSPASGSLFRVGQQVTLAATASDAEDGPLAAGSLRWEVRLHHDQHTHPFVPSTLGSPLAFVFPSPEGLDAAPTSWLEATVTATDSAGLSTTATRRLDARQVDLDFSTSPSGLRLTVEGIDRPSPVRVRSWAGYDFNVTAPSSQPTPSGAATFVRWSDGASASRSITTPDAATAYVATYTGAGGDPRAPVVTLRKLSSTKVELSWTAVAAAKEYAWVLLSCSGAKIKASETRALVKTVTSLKPGCYVAEVRTKLGNGVLGPKARSAPVTLP